MFKELGSLNTVFDLIIAYAPISTQSSNIGVFRLQPVYFYLRLYKRICCDVFINAYAVVLI